MRRIWADRRLRVAAAVVAILALAGGAVAFQRATSPSSSAHTQPTATTASKTGVTHERGTVAQPTAPPATGAIGTWVNITPPGVSLSFNSPPNNYGTQVILTDPQHAGTVYVGTCYQGIWKTVDGGKSWRKINTGQNGAQLDGRVWGLALDHFNPQLMWAANGAGGAQGIWKSTDGGVDWTISDINTVNGQTISNDVYSYTTDPYTPNHVLVTFHTGWNANTSSAGFLESLDAGRTWIVHQPPPGSDAASAYIFFLDNSRTWLLTDDDGYYRTSDGGATWKKVSNAQHQHGGNQLYRARNGTLYAGAVGAIMRSSDDGLTWTPVAQTGHDGYNAVIGDGTYIYAQEANTGGNTAGSPQPYLYTREDDGLTWRPYNGQTFSDGPMSMAVDPATHTVYSSNWDAGVWKLVTRP